MTKTMACSHEESLNEHTADLSSASGLASYTWGEPCFATRAMRNREQERTSEFASSGSVRTSAAKSYLLRR